MAASSKSSAALTAMRRIRTGLLRRFAPKPQKRALCYVKNKCGVWVLEDVCKKESLYEKLKEKMSAKWEKVAERAGGIILDNVLKSAVVTVWGAGVFIITKPLERLGIVETATSSSTKQKEDIASMVKAESKETQEKLEKLKEGHIENKTLINKLSKDLDSQKEVVKLICDKAKIEGSKTTPNAPPTPEIPPSD